MEGDGCMASYIMTRYIMARYSVVGDGIMLGYIMAGYIMTDIMWWGIFLQGIVCWGILCRGIVWWGTCVELEMAVWENKYFNQLCRPHRFCFYFNKLCKIKRDGYKQLCNFSPLSELLFPPLKIVTETSGKRRVAAVSEI